MLLKKTRQQGKWKSVPFSGPYTLAAEHKHGTYYITSKLWPSTEKVLVHADRLKKVTTRHKEKRRHHDASTLRQWNVSTPLAKWTMTNITVRGTINIPSATDTNIEIDLDLRWIDASIITIAVILKLMTVYIRNYVNNWRRVNFKNIRHFETNDRTHKHPQKNWRRVKHNNSRHFETNDSQHTHFIKNEDASLH